MVDEKPRLEKCDILLYKGRGLTSRIIQFLTRSPYNHVAVIVDPAIDLAIESNTGHQSGVRALNLRCCDYPGIDVYRVKEGHPYDPAKVIAYLVGRLGTRYDFWGVFGLGVLKVMSLLTWVRWKPQNPFQMKKDYFCSELCYEAFESAGLDIVPQVGESDITSPGDIARSGRIALIQKDYFGRLQVSVH